MRGPELVVETDALRVYARSFGAFSNNTYLIVDRVSGTGAFVDPHYRCLEAFGAVLGDLSRPVESILITHAHIDHVWGVRAVLEAWPEAAVLAHADGLPMLRVEDVPTLTGGVETMEKYVDTFGGPLFEGVEPTGFLEAGVPVTVGGVAFEVLETPGHCPGHVAFLNERALISGDVLYKGAVGFTNIPGSDPSVLAETIVRTILPLGDDVDVFPGHGPSTTIGVERVSNAFVVGGVGGWGFFVAWVVWTERAAPSTLGRSEGDRTRLWRGIACGRRPEASWRAAHGARTWFSVLV